jgi:hypothetical protein
MKAMTGSVWVAAGLAFSAIALVTEVAVADHPGPFRSAEMSPFTLALVSGGLALATGVLVVVIVMLLTRKPSVGEGPSEKASE